VPKLLHDRWKKPFATRLSSSIATGEHQGCGIALGKRRNSRWIVYSALRSPRRSLHGKPGAEQGGLLGRLVRECYEAR
jgi:hypothetical protein